MQIVPLIAAQVGRYIGLRHDLHAHPELAFEEHRTSDVIVRFLENAGVEVHRGLAGTGVVGMLRQGRSPRAIGLRADMDALPVEEENNFPYRSRHPGRMHACGHDGHTAMLLAAAEYLAQAKSFDGTVYFIFQPAEEGEGGAKAMIEDGLFERFPMDAVFALHNWPGLPVGHFAVHDGPVMAGADQFDITLSGQGAHAAMPQQGTDALLAAAHLVCALQTIVARERDPVESAVLSVTRFHAGEAYNVIAPTARLGGTVRAFKPEVMQAVEAAIRRQATGIAATFRLSTQVDYRNGYPPTINSAREAATCLDVASGLVGRDQVHTDLPLSMGAEDFAYMLRERPGAYVWLGNGPGEGGCTLHNPRYDFNDAALALGASFWVRLTERLLSP